MKALQLLLKGAKNAPKSPSGADVIDVQDTFLTITPDQPRATSSVKVRLLSFENEVRTPPPAERCRPVSDRFAAFARVGDALGADRDAVLTRRSSS